jgi:glycine cleavage system regulatory protein
MTNHLVVTILAEDRPGIVEQIAQTIIAHSGNWMESSMNRLAGKFAGILLIEVDAQHNSLLQDALIGLSEYGITITVEDSNYLGQHEVPLCIEIIANDRPGIVGEIAAQLASKKVNLESLETFCDSAPMSAGMMFHAHAYIQLPEGMSQTDLTMLLEGLSDDLMVEIIDI